MIPVTRDTFLQLPRRMRSWYVAHDSNPSELAVCCLLNEMRYSGTHRGIPKLRPGSNGGRPPMILRSLRATRS